MLLDVVDDAFVSGVLKTNLLPYSNVYHRITLMCYVYI